MLPAVRMTESSPPPRGAAQKSVKPKAESEIRLAGKRVVIVEDEGVTQLQLRRICRSEGIEVAGVASNGQEAIQVVLEQKPDLVLMDVQMPIMNGLEAARYILERFRACIVMLTAFSEEEYRQEAQAIGVCGYIVKPVTAEILIPQMAAALQKFSQQ